MPIDATKSKAIVHRTFEIGILFKGLDGLLEIIGGVLLFVVSPVSVSQLILWLTQHELSEDPQDLIANYLANAAHHFSVSTQRFGGFYLLSHGIMKVIVVVSLWKHKLWAYPMAIIFFLIFIAYQIYRYCYSHSMGLMVLTVLDVLIVILTVLEYRQQRIAHERPAIRK